MAEETFFGGEPHLSFDQKTDELRFSIGHVIGNNNQLLVSGNIFPAVHLYTREKRENSLHEGSADIKKPGQESPLLEFKKNIKN